MSLSKNPVPVSVATWVEEQKHEYIWKIKSFPKTVSDYELLRYQKFVIEAGKNTPLHSRWVISLGFTGTGGSDSIFSIDSRLDTIFDPKITELLSRFRIKIQDVNGSLQSIDGIPESSKLNHKHVIVCRWDPSYLDSSGALTLLITLSLFKVCHDNDVETLEAQFQAATAPAAQQNLAELLDSESVGFDAKIVCSDGKEINCHKQMLKMCSPVFKTMLESDFSEAKTGVIKVTDVSSQVMEVLIQLIYTGQLMKVWKDPEFTLEVTYAAGKYEMKPLLEFLDRILGKVGADYDPATLFALKNLAGKLELEKAEAELKDRIIKRTLSSKRPADMDAVFGNIGKRAAMDEWSE